MGEPVGVGAGLDDVAAEGEPVDDRSAEAWFSESLSQPANDLFEAIAAEFFSSLVNLAAVHGLLDDFEHAKLNYARAIAILGPLVEPDQPTLATARARLASILAREVGQHEEL